ncbi:A-type flagellin [Candidatus Arcanobacter lacustris]|jgi:flagellin|uniref:Flagellin n=1 Tax=Candidatus Arcanibacter lacustris TaxID=1607817 RepID=A0A0F5MP23_9RICK|nr:A-type flagellin [Candidatus Arcanobacter lacustris]
MVVGIISNIAAISAQINLQTASNDSQASIYRLSSGNAINQASDDVGGLAVGTILKTNVSTLKAALSNTAQAQSMLGVADGALSNVGDILQRQKALASQATSGSLSDQARSFLNQEFSNLALEVDRISGTTNFNGINLIDGSLFAPSTLNTNASETNSIAASSVLSFVNATMAAADTLVIAGVTFTAQTTMTESPMDIDLTTNTASGNVSAIQQAITKTINFVPTGAAGIDTPALAAKNTLSKFNFVFDTTTNKITITAKNGGTVDNALTVGSTVAGGTSGDILLNGNNVIGATSAFSTGTAGVNGDLYSGTMSTATNAYNGSETTVAQGNVSDTVLTALNFTTAASTGVDASGISNNEAFHGKVQGFKATYTQPGYVDLQITVGSSTYLAKNVSTAPTAAQAVTFGCTQGNGGYFNLKFDSATNSGGAAVANQADADSFAGRVDRALSGVDFFQKRTISSYSGGGSVYPVGSTTSNGNLAGSSFKFINNDFTNLKVEAVSVQAPSAGGANASITIRVNGEDYISGFDNTGAVLSGGLSTVITHTGGNGGKYGFVNVNDAKKVLAFTYTSTTNLDMSTSINAQGVQNALEQSFGINTGASNLTFQVGTTATDTIGVQIQSSKTKDIYTDSSGTYKELNISTQAGAVSATSILDNAINNVTSARAQVGALESRFKYASNNLNVTIQNQDAARGTFLDADISTESTRFAQSQVKVQASISVLAQANQLPQSLLKLIG